MSPFVAFLVLLICSLIPTTFIYMVIAKAVANNLATIKGTIQGFAVELGGPVAFYVILLLLGKAFIPPYPHAEITLKGIVRDSEGKPQKGYFIATLYEPLKSEDPEGYFQINARREDTDTYSFLVMKENMPWVKTNQLVPNPEDIILEPLTNASLTKVTGDVGNTIHIHDHAGRPVNGNYILSLEPSMDPRQVPLREGQKVEMSIENAQYMAIIRDANGQIRTRELLPHMPQGVPYQINKTFTLGD